MGHLRLFGLLLVASATLLAGAAEGHAVAGRASSVGVVRSVYDGDTLTLTDGRRVRLLQIDTPELRSGECYSRAARTALVRLVPVGSRVRLEIDPALDRVDRYERLLRYVWHAGVDASLELVRLGAATPYFYRGDRGRYASALLAAAKQAKAAHRGLWKACPSTVLDPTAAVTTGGTPSLPAKGTARCDPNYAGCVPSYPPDLDCADIRALGLAPVRVVGSDPHRLDGDGDGWGCE